MKPLFKILFFLLLCAGKNYAQVSNTKSYQVSIDFKEAAASNTEMVPNLSVANANIIYFDGLGRPVQQNAVKGSATEKDVVKHIEYNLNGDRVREYLAVPTMQAGGSYVGNAKDLTSTYYSTMDYENTLNPYSEKVLEKSPERRVMAQGFPGNDWDPAVAGNHAVKFEYKANTLADAVKKFTVSTTYNASLKLYVPSVSESGTYAANELYKNIVKNENWVSGVNNTTEEYTDKLGQVVLKRNYNNGQAHDTYYAYDIYGNLSYVLPPLANGSITAQSLDLYGYQYRYDHRNRLIEKKLPQKDWEYLVYDSGDRVVMSGPVYSPFGDGSKGWIINKYDVLGRIIFKGYYAGSTFTSAVRYSLSQNSFSAETKAGDNTVDGVWVIYSNNSFPTDFALLNVYYYDEYWFPFAPTSFPAVEGQTPNTALRGQLTGTVTRVLTNASSKVNYMSYILYDNKYRVIRDFTTNPQGGYIQVDYKLNFSGLPTKTVTYQRQGTNTAVLTITDNYNYDNSNRLLAHTQQINNGPLETIAVNGYDELGMLIKKDVGGTASKALQNVEYRYNIRGWLTDVNDTYLLAPDERVKLFNMQLQYNKNGYVSGITPLYNGNISSVMWRTRTDGITRANGFEYDHLNRLQNAYGMEYEGNWALAFVKNDAYNEKLTYDKNGNILTLKRTGEVVTGQKTEIDDLSYSYTGNQLQSVTDATNSAEGFNDANKTGNDYIYDTFGNITSDKNKGITAVSYNHLNLPYKVTFGNGGSISYTYDANGTRLAKKVQPSGGTAVTTDYLNGFQYENGVLQTFPHAEGYVKNNAGTYIYHYIYKDHLGNNRLVYADLNKDGTINPATEIIEENNYYPFGLKHKGYNEIAGTGYKYKFGGKELNSELGLELYDFGARNYDAAIGRWLNMDPLAEDFISWSPYNYTYNNPINWIDPTGMGPEGLFTRYIDEKGKTLLNTNDGSNAVVTVSNEKKDSFLRAVKATKDKSLLNSKEWNFTMKYNLVGDWSQWHENTQSWFSTEEARMNIARFWKTGDYDYFEQAVSSHTSELRSDIISWALSIAGSLHGINIVNSWRGNSSNNINYTIGAARKGYDKMMNFGKIKVSAETFHREIKPNILSKSGNFSKIVGRNPDIKIEGNQIRLQGTGPYKGKSYNTGLNVSDFF